MTRVGYIRTSTNKQYTDRQVNELKDQCDRLVIEDGVSARKKNRPLFRKLCAELELGDRILVMSYRKLP